MGTEILRIMQNALSGLFLAAGEFLGGVVQRELFEGEKSLVVNHKHTLIYNNFCAGCSVYFSSAVCCAGFLLGHLYMASFCNPTLYSLHGDLLCRVVENVGPRNIRSEVATNGRTSSVLLTQTY